jgi:alkylhydroperoxidase family enzyme
MARLPYPDRTTFPQELQDFLAQVPEHLNFDMMSYSVSTIELFIRQGQAQYTGLELSPRDRELVILTTAARTKADYEFIQHVPISEATGVDPALREAIRRQETGSAAIPARDQAIVAFAAAVADGPFVPDEVFAAVRDVLGPREIVEALQVIGFYWSFGRVATVLQVEIEAAHGTAVVQASRDFGAGGPAEAGQ